jgi:hypothetical protein
MASDPSESSSKERYVTLQEMARKKRQVVQPASCNSTRREDVQGWALLRDGEVERADLSGATCGRAGALEQGPRKLTLFISFMEAVFGTTVEVVIPAQTVLVEESKEEERLTILVPPGTQPGDLVTTSSGTHVESLLSGTSITRDEEDELVLVNIQVRRPDPALIDEEDGEEWLRILKTIAALMVHHARTDVAVPPPRFVVEYQYDFPGAS